MGPEQRFLRLCALVACASFIAALLPVPACLRIVLALPLVFVLPGMALLRALNLRFTPGAHAPILVGISMAITVLGGLALNWLGGLRPVGWAVWLGGVSVVAAIVARRYAAPGPRQPIPALRLRHGVMLVATAAVLVLTVQGSMRATAAYRPFPHTSFWMLPLTRSSNVYMIGIKNEEMRPETYAVQLMVDQQVTGEWRNLTLVPGQTETYPVTVQMGAPAEAWLYRSEQPELIYRRVTIAGANENDGASNASFEANAASGGP